MNEEEVIVHGKEPPSCEFTSYIRLVLNYFKRMIFCSDCKPHISRALPKEQDRSKYHESFWMGST